MGRDAIERFRPMRFDALSRKWRAELLGARHDAALRSALFATGCCLSVVFVAGAGAYLIFGPARDLVGVLNPPGVVDQLGSVRDVLVAPFARWDSAWYLTIAHYGYGFGPDTATFFPLYPLLLSTVGALGPGDLVAGVLISVVCLFVALCMIWRLTNLEFGAAYPDAPRLAVFVTALFPTAFFLTAVYPEAFLLAVSVSAVWMARQGRWAWAGLLGGLGAAAHSLGVLIAVPLALLYLGDHRWRLRADVLWLALAPAGYGLFMAYLGLRGLDPLSPLHSHEAWLRDFKGPVTGVSEAIEAVVAGVRQLLSDQSTRVYWPAAISYGYDPMTAARDNLELFAFLLIAVTGMIGALRRLPIAYGAYVAVVLVVVISYPITAQPLSGLSRYVAVLFPVQMVAARWLAIHRRWRLPVVGLSALALAYYAGAFATWHWVA
jgi:Mannosyltransferase (PIG-V)